MDDMVLDLCTWQAFENPNDTEVVDDEFSLEAELAAADAEAAGRGDTLGAGQPQADDFEPI